jgi:biopolymer transport protein ExbB
MLKKNWKWMLLSAVMVPLAGFNLYAAAAAAPPADGGTLWQLIASGGTSMIFMGVISVVATASVIYHFQNVRAEKLVPRDVTQNILTLIKKKEYAKATQVCRQQSNIISAIALKGLEKVSEGKDAVRQAMEDEGRTQIERLWRNLTYLGDIAMIAPMLGLLGTILGMIDAFHYFKPEAIHPVVLTQGLAKAMINTAAGLIITVPALVFYSYFRGQVSMITSTAETAVSDLEHAIGK